MSYYLGLIGLGLFFVLLVHLYNHWTLYKFKQDEKKQADEATTKAAAERSAHQTPSTTLRKAKPFVMAPSSTSAPNASIPFTTKKPEDHPHNDLHNTTSSPFTTEYPFEIQGMGQYSEDEIFSWLQHIQQTSTYISSIALMDIHHQWTTLWQQRPLTETPLPNTLPFKPILEAKIIVLLANRRGYITREELESIQSKVKALKHSKNKASRQLKITQPSLDKLAKCAEEIDKWCTPYDVQIALTLACRDPAGISGGQISHESSQAGMIFENGVFHKHDDQGNVMFSLEFSPSGEVPTRLEDIENCIGQQATLYLDIPRVANGRAVFEEMTVFAQHLAALIRADLVNEQMQQLSTIFLETIAQQIEQVQLNMTNDGIEPGSKIALKLFS